MTQRSDAIDIHGLGGADQHWNLTPAALVEAAVRKREGRLTNQGALLTITTPHTGRSPNDRFVVQEAPSDEHIWWGDVNTPLTPDKFKALKNDVEAYLSGRELFVHDVYTCADPAHRLKVRLISEGAWQTLFTHNMFLRPPDSEIADFVPDFTILHAPLMETDPERHGTRSSTGIVLDLGQGLVVIAGTRYAGEIKKTIFTALNYLLPQAGVISMHCSANMGHNGDTALFFGLSGTGKTTLSADSRRVLIGDDEHGWSDEGIFNLEGGCYAKVIRLSSGAEPEIYSTLSKFGTILENVKMDGGTRKLDLDSEEITENTRASYPIDYIPNHVPSGRGGHPDNVLFLTADAFGVLPPISKLTRDQAIYHFLSGYTAKLAGTERGVTKPQATFSACFGEPFLLLHPMVYATMLGEKLHKYGVTAWLVNTGWSGGPYGVGSRMKIEYTRAMVNAALDGSLAKVQTRPHPIFGVHMPIECPGIPSEVLSPRDAWDDKDAYDRHANDLAKRFSSNFEKFSDRIPSSIADAGPLV